MLLNWETIMIFQKLRSITVVKLFKPEGIVIIILKTNSFPIYGFWSWQGKNKEKVGARRVFTE